MNARLKYFAPSAMLISADSGSGAESLKTMRLCFDAKKNYEGWWNDGYHLLMSKEGR